jgi:tRNA 2-selenouridine synthase
MTGFGGITGMFQDITIEELLELRKSKQLALVDVRSPGEFADSTIPGSVNVPFFDDEERADVGTLYTRVGVKAAKQRGLEIISRKLPLFIRQFEEIEGRKAVFCWRGGMRSKSSATVIDLMGMPVYRLVGGVRAYRKWVVDQLANFELQQPCVVLNGNTGTGKTKILQKLAAMGYPVVDLEAMAMHRGSIFGQIGLTPNNQKTFDSLIIEQLLQYRDAPFIMIEAESKRVGKVVLPDFLVEAKEQGIQICLDMPVATRTQHIIEDYQPDSHKEECMQSFARIRSKIHTPIASEIDEALQANRWEQAVTLLLEHYYDPRYEFAFSKHTGEPVLVHAEHVDDAVGQIAAILDRSFPDFSPSTVSNTEAAAYNESKDR